MHDSAVHPDIAYVEGVVEEEEVGAFSRFEAAEFAVEAEDAGRGEGGDADGGGEVDADGVHVADHEVQAAGPP